MVFTAIFTTALVPVSLKYCLEWLKRHRALTKISKREGYPFFGASPLARNLAKIIKPYSPVKLLDLNRDNCNAAAAEGLNAHVRDVTDEDFLHELGISQVHATVAATRNSAVNLLAAQLVSDTYQVPENHLVLRKEHFKAYEYQRLDSRAHLLFGMPIDMDEWEVLINNGQFRYTEVPIDKTFDSGTLNVKHTSSWKLPFVVKRDKSIPPFAPDAQLKEGDTVGYLKIDSSDLPFFEQFDHLIKRCKILDIKTTITPDDLFSIVADNGSWNYR